MRHILLFKTVLAVILSATAASASITAPMIGNTVSVAASSGEVRYYFNENGSVAMANVAGASDIGTWNEDGQRLCVIWSSQNAERCLDLPQGEISVGTPFNINDADGNSLKATILQGKVPF